MKNDIKAMRMVSYMIVHTTCVVNRLGTLQVTRFAFSHCEVNHLAALTPYFHSPSKLPDQ